MILGIGTDIAQVERFKSWLNYSEKQLLRVFSEQELEYCCDFKNKSKYRLESLASRFAAKESFFKALSATLVKLNLTQNKFSLLFTCQNIEVVKTTWDVPKLKVNWEAFEEKVGRKLSNFNVELSISHEKNYVVSYVLIWQ